MQKIKFLNFESFITSRLTGKKKSKLSRPVIRIAITSVATGVFVMILSIAIITGFKNEIREKVIGFGSHLQITAFDNNVSTEMNPIVLDSNVFQQIVSIQEVSHIQSFATKAGIIRTADETHGVILKGIGNEYDWGFFGKNIIAGKKPDIVENSKSSEVLISKQIANMLSLGIDDYLRLYFIPKSGKTPRARKLLISGIYETGLLEFDEQVIICDIQHIQKLNNWTSNQVSGYEIILNDFDEIEQLEESVYEKIPYSYNVQSIKTTYPQIFDWLDLQDINVVVLLVLMILVSIITMISTLLVLILEQTQTVGILKALGATNRSIRKIFIYQAINIVLRGMAWGSALGIAFCVIQYNFHIIKLPQEAYYMSFVPINFNILHIALVNIGTLLICSSVLILPTFIITKISPIQTIRYE